MTDSETALMSDPHFTALINLRSRCLFCRAADRSFITSEHVIPESLGNTIFVLPPGIVCDACNNYFATNLEEPILSSSYFRSARFYDAIPSKRGRVPNVKAIVPPVYEAEVARDGDNALQVFVEDRAEDLIRSGSRTHLIIPRPIYPEESILFARFLGKVAIETMALKFLENRPGDLAELIDNDRLDTLRHYVRRGSPSKSAWPIWRRQILNASRSSIAEQDLNPVLHEWTFLSTEHNEIYFVISLFDVEYVLNMGGPDLEGFHGWLAANKNTSPLSTR